VSIAQNIFSNKLVQGVTTSVPGVDPESVINSGATNLRNILTPDQLTEVLRIFMDSLKDAYIVPIALTGVGFFLALLLKKDMRASGGLKIAI
jgi:MFS transporter, DHA2 family, glioxin efflux transporter